VASGMKAGERVVVVLADSIRNYMSKFLNDNWMIEHGFMTEKPHPSFSHHSVPSSSSPSSQPSTSALLASSWWKARTVADLKLETPLTVTPAVTCQQCVDILNKQGYDQLPCVSNDNQILGMVTLGNLTSLLLSSRVQPDDSITRCLYTQFKKVGLQTALSKLSEIFDHDHFALVVTSQRCFDKGGAVSEKSLVFGIVTRIDLLNFIVTSRPRGASVGEAADSSLHSSAAAAASASALAVSAAQFEHEHKEQSTAQQADEKKEASSVYSIERM